MPNKGRLHEPTIELLERAELHLDNSAEHKLYAETVDPDVTVLLARVADIPEYIRDGAAEVSITGLNQARESSHEPEGLLDLEYGRYRLVLAAPEDGGIETVTDMSGEAVTAELPHIARTYFEEEGIDTKVVEVTGATGLTPHVGITDAIIGITLTGTTLRVNRSAVIDEMLSSSVRLFTRPDTVDDPKIQQLLMALESVRFTEGKRYLMMNAPHERLDKVREVILGFGGPTVVDVVGNSTVTVHTVVNERDVFEVISDLKNVSASGTLTTEIGRLVE